MLNICLTFDYELFFGQNFGTYDEILFDPTERLLDVLQKKNISATFFADVCSIPQAMKYGQRLYVDGFQRQLRSMLNCGQDIQLHLHPHWFYSKWIDGQWCFSNKGYRLHSFGFKNCGMSMEAIIKNGISYLKEQLLPVDPEYWCMAYRAGGFSLQPHNELIRLLYKNGIRVDSSVAQGLYAKTEANYYDYRHKIRNINWFISPDHEWWDDVISDESILEIPIATMKKNIVGYVKDRMINPRKVKLDLGNRRGTYIAQPDHSKVQLVFKLLCSKNLISLDAYPAEYLYWQLKRFYRFHKCDDMNIAVIGHPKLINKKYISNLCDFIDYVTNDGYFKFVSIAQAYKNIVNEKNRGNG